MAPYQFMFDSFDSFSSWFAVLEATQNWRENIRLGILRARAFDKLIQKNEEMILDCSLFIVFVQNTETEM